MKYSPSLAPTICAGNVLTLYDTVRSFFNNYVYYKWQRSTDGGATWSDVTVASGPATPFWNGTAWEYVSSYTVPAGQTQLINNGDKYRLVVATTLSNLSNVSCRFTDAGSIVTLNIIDCGILLSTQLISFTGRVSNENVVLQWITAGENEPLLFDVEKSNDGISFSTIATIHSYNDYAAEQSSYSYIDPSPLSGKQYYRIRMKNNLDQSRYSRTVQFSAIPDIFSFVFVINPFNKELVFEVSSDQNGTANVSLVDPSGKTVRQASFNLSTGINHLVLDHTGNLASGIYFLRVQSAGVVLQKKVIKQEMR
jgi:hypothetical protein